MSSRFVAFRDFTSRAFALAPLSLTMLVVRISLALPFWKSGLTKWDGWLTLSFGARALFADEFRLHIFGMEYPYPAPQAMAYAAALGETVLPVLLALGLATRYAALGLLCMTGVIQLTVPDGWQTYHLPWAALALTVLTFGPGKAAADYWLGIER